MVTRAVLLLLLVLLGVFNTPENSQRFAMVGASCSTCRMHEELRELSLQAIKEQILNKLGLRQAPNMTGRALPRIPALSKLMDMYGMQSDQPQSFGPTYEDDEYSAKTESVFALAQPHPRMRHSKSNLDVLYFTFTDKVLQSRVVKAELNLWVWGVNSDGDLLELDNQDEGLLTITLQRILRGTSENGGTAMGPPLITKHARPQVRRGGWITIELRRMVAEWFRHPRDNLGVAVKIAGPDGHRRSPNKLIEIDSSSDHAPYLELQIEELESRQRTRVKRNIGLNCDEHTQESRCCRYKLTVDFEKFGWDWVIAPKKYEANYCSGECPMAFLTLYPNTHIVSLADKPMNNTGPCCAPRKLSEITMLYFDNEYQIVFSRLPGMVVERCGCS
ncbi:growth/differentiation factor 11-like [Pseudomyrmex gracilis]|uniref:growth/differentiation factor 11-like n=1 Tax=Pseudomyrmex gracilis TaxID=219809 RepID=UPI000995123D|nr:growth/differentiation factor 11-like [Pseudomyrmex gracilis]